MIYVQHIWAVVSSIGLALKLQLMFLFDEAVIRVPFESVVALNKGVAHLSVLWPGASFHTLCHTKSELNFWSSLKKPECSVENCSFDLNLLIHYSLCILLLGHL